MAHHAPTIKPADDPAFKLPAPLAALSLPAMVVGVVLLLVGWGIGSFAASPRIGMSAYLVAFMYCFTLAIGCLFFVMIQHLVRAGWSVVIRRLAELVMIAIIPLSILFVPIIATLLFGEGTLYGWDVDGYDEIFHLKTAVWKEKSRWLNQYWFAARAILYLGVYIWLALYFYRGSVEQDSTGELKATERMQYLAGPCVMAFALMTSFAAFDWVMSLAPMWFSTMFGVYIFAGSILSAHCLLCLGSWILQKQGAIRDEVSVEHYHDLGKYIFGFIFFWTYISFSQYLLIWYGNIPEETEWFYHRQVGEWGLLSIFIIFFHWIIPFMGTMSRHVRRRPTLMACWAAYILILHFVDVYWMIMPEAATVAPGEAPASINVISVLAPLLCSVGMVSAMLGYVLRVADANRIVAVRDPRLAESIAFENI